VKETDAIFAHVAAAHERAAADPFCLRTSIDTKAKVKIGRFSRRGKSRLPKPAADHDMAPDAILVPFGVLEVSRGAEMIQQLNVLFGHSRETADFIVDGLTLWWLSRREHHQGVRRLMIELDNGPEISSARTQFLKRMVQFADETGLEIELVYLPPYQLVYLPPYHSKYNPIERGWGVLEQHWNGAILDTTETALEWARTMIWRGVKSLVYEIKTTYERGVKLTSTAMRPIFKRLQRDSALPKWSLVISPKSG
jgi:transposase